MFKALTYQQNREHGTKNFIKDGIGSFIITSFILLFVLFQENTDIKVVYLLLFSLGINVTTLLFLFANKQRLALKLYYLFSIVIISAISWTFPQLKLEGLFFIPLGLTIFLYNLHLKASVSMFLAYVSLALFFHIYESYFLPEQIIEAPFITYNKYIIFALIGFIALKGVYLIQSNIDFILRLQKTADKLKTTQQRHQNLFENSYDSVMIYNNKEKIIIACNEKFLSTFQYSKEDISKLSAKDITPEFQEDGRSSKEHILEHNKLFKQAKPIRFEFSHQRKNGEIFPTETTIIPDKNNSDELIVIINDISVEKKTSQALEASEEKFRTMIEASPSGLIMVDLNGAPQFISKRAAEIFGYDSPDEILKLPFLNNLYPEEKEAAEKNIAFLLKGKQSLISNQYRCLKKDGSQIQIETRTKLLRNEKGVATQIIIFFDDISARVKAEKALNERNIIYQSLIDHSTDGIDIIEMKEYDPKNQKIEGKIIVRNEVMNKLLNNTKGLFIDRNEILRLSPTSINGRRACTILKEQIPVLLKNRFIKYPWKLEHPDGSTFDITTVQQYITVGKKEVLIRIFKDITQQKKAEEKLKLSQLRYQTLLDASPDGIIVTDMKGKLTYASPRIKVRYGYTPEAVFIGLDAINFVANDSKELTMKQLNNIRESKEIRNLLTKVVHKNKSHFYLESNVKLMYDKNGKPAEVLMVQRDVTERIKQNETIKKQLNDLNLKNKELQKYIDSNMELENFAYIASHDLQAPIRNIISFTQLLERSLENKMNTDEREYLDFVVSASKNMKRLIDDLLTFSRVNTIKCNFNVLNVADLLTIIQLELKSTIEEKQASIEIKDALPKQIIGDKTKIRQLFQNLIINGLKFTNPNTKPKITIHFKDQKDHWYFAIQDNGIGIKEEFKEKIFLIFQRLHTTRDFEGTGIGLALCKKIVEQHLGKLGLDSTFGEGSTFYFTIKKGLK